MLLPTVELILRLQQPPQQKFGLKMNFMLEIHLVIIKKSLKSPVNVSKIEEIKHERTAEKVTWPVYR